ncbi:sugar ABC transporter ATP-binding protein [Acidisoma cellulosilytica]|uniref:Sugar ABC transporter ATP-binding protein n=1 Tax=Acidisoma cellulosilyticum TaxID=2802395 RepID=A0A964E526_9PROT|nr:sugar ABC transporter ATP-binding protein [Acidisoma cellulosilyticum]MCB8882059.1 sugar ABC transporter ATP-binding protein [Acidisoma cellulosilyticum]
MMLEILELSKSYGAVAALSGVSFSAERGKVTALLGENGAGKSTLVKILSGLVVPTEGKIALDGHIIDTSTPDRASKSGVAVVQQEISVLPNLSITENFMLTAPSALLRRAKAASACRAYLDRLGLGDVDVGRPTGSLSVGERQLVEIARMLAQDAQVLVLDEPTAALGDRDIALVHQAVRRLAAEGKVVLYITHRLNELEEICEQAVVLRNGQVADRFATADTSIARVIYAMVGRELNELYPAVGNRAEPDGSSASNLVLTGLRTAGLLGSVDLDLKPGEIVATAGQIGSGFVEPLRAVAGVTAMTAGTMRLQGKAYSPRNHRERCSAGVAYCSADRQLDGFFPDRPVWETMSAPALAASGLWGSANGQRLRRSTDRLADRMTISLAYRDRAVRALSGGNAQKVSIGKWLSNDPQLLLVEEPTRGVDVGARAEVYRVIRSLADQGLSVLFASTDLDEVLGFGERVMIFHNRRQVETLPASALTRDKLATWITHGSCNG